MTLFVNKPVNAPNYSPNAPFESVMPGRWAQKLFEMTLPFKDKTDRVREAHGPLHLTANAKFMAKAQTRYFIWTI